MCRQILERIHPKKMSLRGKLVLSTFFVALVITIASVVGFAQAITTSNTLLYSQTAISQGYISEQIASSLDSIMDTSYYIDMNATFQNAMISLSENVGETIRLNARSEISTLIYQYYQSNFINIIILPATDSPIVWGRYTSEESPEVLEEAKELAVLHKGAAAWLPSGRDDGSMLCVRQVLNYRKPFLQNLGYIIIRVDFDKIVREAARRIINYPDYSLSIYLADTAIYPPKNDGRIVLPLPDASSDLYEIGTVEGEHLFVTYTNITTASVYWDLVLGIPYQMAFRSQLRANFIYAGMLVAAILFSILASWMILRSVTTQFHLLTEKMKRVRRGDLRPYPNQPPYESDEMGILNQEFDDMTVEFQRVIKDNYVKELLLTQTKLKSLEQQMNPHFLYNALESIRWFSQRKGDDPVAAIAKSLGNLLRQSLSDKQMAVTVKKELQIVEDYLQIQQIRFPETLEACLQIEEEVMDLIVPKMSIQPLVENAIIHSLEEIIGVCHIDIRVKRDAGILLVEVENDGSSIDENILTKIQNGDVIPKGNGIGLNNIDMRIKLLYGDEYGLSFFCGEERSIVSYRIPATTEVPEKSWIPENSSNE